MSRFKNFKVMYKMRNMIFDGWDIYHNDYHGTLEYVMDQISHYASLGYIAFVDVSECEPMTIDDCVNLYHPTHVGVNNPKTPGIPTSSTEYVKECQIDIDGNDVLMYITI